MGSAKLRLAGVAVALVVGAILALRKASSDEASSDVDVRSTPEHAASPTDRRVVAERSTRKDPSAPVVEIDDAPFPDGATLTIRGTVRDSSGLPIPGARVLAEAAAELPERISDGSRNEPTDADGRYVIARLDPRVPWSMQAACPRGYVASRWAKAALATSNRMDLRYDFVLARTGALDVVVLDERGAPIEHRTSVRSDASPGNEMGAAGLEPGRYRVYATAPGRAGEFRDVEVADDATTRVEFLLRPATSIAGVLLSSDGGPMRGFAVHAESSGEWLDPDEGAAWTADDGTFRIDGLRRARYVVRTRDGAAADADGPVEAPASGVVLRARADAKATFHLVYPPECSVRQRSADVNVVVVAASERGRAAVRWEYDRATLNVPSGIDAELLIDAPGCATERRAFRARPDERIDLGDVAPVALLEVSGRVVDEAGRGVPGALVIGPFNLYRRRDLADEHGSFRLGRLAPGEIVVDAHAAGFADTTTRYVVGHADPLVVVLHHGGRLLVRARSAAGARLAETAVRLVSPTGDVRTETLDAFGECATRLAAGTWRVEIEGLAVVRAEVRENATTTVLVGTGAR